MLKILSPVVAILLFFFLLIVSFGYYADPDYQKESSALYFDNVNLVWEVLTNVEKYPDSKKDLMQVEILERKFNAIVKWRETFANGTIKEYEILEKSTPRIFVVKMKDYRTGLEGTWTYMLTKYSDKTKLSITEESRLDHLLWRGWHTLIGRDYNMKFDFKWLRVKLFEELLMS